MIIKNNLYKEENENNPFTVPENYFDKLPDEIISKCNQQAKKHKIYTLKKYLSYAAILIIALTSSILLTFYLSNEKNDMNKLSYENLMEEILYIADMNDIDDNFMIECITENKKCNNSDDSNYDEIIEYMDNETANTNEIIELIEY